MPTDSQEQRVYDHICSQQLIVCPTIQNITMHFLEFNLIHSHGQRLDVISQFSLQHLFVLQKTFSQM